MIDSILNTLFRCSHQRLTRPVTAATKIGVHNAGAYVVCLDCGKQFSYDLDLMRIGKAIDRSHYAGVVPPDLPKTLAPKVPSVFWALPLGVLIGALFQRKKKRTTPTTYGQDDERPAE